MAAFVYILHCSDGSYFVGNTGTTVYRLDEHALGLESAYTRKRLPVKLLYFEEFADVQKAALREKQLQGWSRAKKEALISGDFEKLKILAKSKSNR